MILILKIISFFSLERSIAVDDKKRRSYSSDFLPLLKARYRSAENEEKST